MPDGANEKDLLLRIKAEFPKNVTDKLTAHMKKLEASGKNLGKDTEKWHTHVKGLTAQIAISTVELEKQSRLVTKLEQQSKKARGQRQVDTQRDLVNAKRSLEGKTKYLGMLRQEHAAVKAIQGVMDRKQGGGMFAGGMSAFRSGGLKGVGGHMMSSGLGKLGVAGAAAYGIKKTYDWAREKGSTARGAIEDSQALAERLGGGASRASVFEKVKGSGKQEMYSSLSMMKAYGSLVGKSGGYLDPRSSLESMAYMGRRGVGFEDSARLMGSGAHTGAMAGKNPTDYMRFILDTLTEGVKAGFDKSERVSQLISLQRYATKATGETSSAAFKSMAQMLVTLEATGRKGLKGEGGLKAIEKVSDIFLDSGFTQQAALLEKAGVIDFSSTRKRLEAEGDNTYLHSKGAARFDYVRKKHFETMSSDELKGILPAIINMFGQSAIGAQMVSSAFLSGDMSADAVLMNEASKGYKPKVKGGAKTLSTNIVDLMNLSNESRNIRSRKMSEEEATLTSGGVLEGMTAKMASDIAEGNLILARGFEDLISAVNKTFEGKIGTYTAGKELADRLTRPKGNR